MRTRLASAFGPILIAIAVAACGNSSSAPTTSPGSTFEARPVADADQAIDSFIQFLSMSGYEQKIDRSSGEAELTTLGQAIDVIHVLLGGRPQRTISDTLVWLVRIDGTFGLSAIGFGLSTPRPIGDTTYAVIDAERGHVSRVTVIPGSPSAPHLCADQSGHPSCDPDRVIDSTVIMLQGPREPHIIDRSRSGATMIRRDQVETELQALGVDAINFHAELWSYDLWLIEIHGEFAEPVSQNPTTFSLERVPGTTFGVFDPANGTAEELAFLPD